MANLFVSHSWKYSEDYENLVKLLKARGYFDFRNYSIPETEPIGGTSQQIWNEISANIQWSSIVILIAGVYASYSESMIKEVKIAKSYGKPILAIKPFGNTNTSFLTDYADKEINWNTESIVSAIRELT